jgi:hypothetical protein
MRVRPLGFEPSKAHIVLWRLVPETDVCAGHNRCGLPARVGSDQHLSAVMLSRCCHGGPRTGPARLAHALSLGGRGAAPHTRKRVAGLEGVSQTGGAYGAPSTEAPGELELEATALVEPPPARHAATGGLSLPPGPELADLGHDGHAGVSTFGHELEGEELESHGVEPRGSIALTVRTASAVRLEHWRA